VSYPEDSSILKSLRADFPRRNSTLKLPSHLAFFGPTLEGQRV
jgi:hypothetical protein